MVKSLKDISWDVPEEIYRKDESLSYSCISKYIRTGFHSIKSIFDKIDTPSLTFGSLVDMLITGDENDFENNFYILKETSPTPKVKEIVGLVRSLLNDELPPTMDLIPKNLIMDAINAAQYQQNWSEEKRYASIIEKAESYYLDCYKSIGKKIITQEEYEDAIKCADVLKNDDTTRFYFQDDPFNNDIERLYQLKFKGINNGIPYKCMLDLIVVDHRNKTIQPIDLKTSGSYEDEFFKSFIKWNYDIQARNYYRLLRDAVINDDYFKDFTINDYKFIVINRTNLKPLVWDFEGTKLSGDIVLENKETNKKITFKDPWDVGVELWHYLNKENAIFPDDINFGENKSNSITDHIVKEYLI